MKRSKEHNKKIGESNKGKKRSEETKKKMSEVRKGKHYSRDTEFKKGNISVFKGKKRLNLQGDHHHNWKGDKVGYFSLHAWIKRIYGKPYSCEKCGITNKTKKIEWANISGKYLRERNDYMTLCTKHHKMMDNKCPDICPCGNPHYSNGFCSKCYDKLRKRKNKTLIINGVKYIKE